MGWMTVAVAAKVVLWALQPAHGLNAAYFADTNNPLPGAQPERSTDFDIPGFTRRDLQLDFHGRGFALSGQPWPLWFVNDYTRFGWVDDPQKRRYLFPFTVRWSGWLYVPVAVDRLMLVVDSDEQFELVIGNRYLFGGEPERGDSYRIRFDQWNEGLYPVSASLAHGAKPLRPLSLQWNLERWGGLGPPRPIPSSYLYPERPRVSPAVDQWMGLLAAVPDFAVVGLVLLAAVRTVGAAAADRRSTPADLVRGVALLAVCAVGTFVVADVVRPYTFNVMGSGNDDLTYETYARHIAFSGDWLLRELQPGPYYFQILYPYYLRLVHLFLGEPMVGAAILQFLSLCAAGWLAGRLVSALGGGGAAAAGATALAVLAGPMLPISLTFFPVGTLLLVGTVWACARADRPRDAAIAGALAALAALQRSNFVVLLPLGAAWLLSDLSRGLGTRVRLVLVFLTVGGAVVLPFSVRNAVVAGEFVVLTKGQFAANLSLSGIVPPDFRPVAQASSYQELERLVAFCREQPRLASERILGKALFVVGVRAGDHGGVLWWMVLPSVLGGVGALVLLVRGGRDTRRRTVFLVAVVGSQFLILLATRGDHPRLLVPLVPLLYAAAAAGLARLAADMGRGRAAVLHQLRAGRTAGAG